MDPDFRRLRYIRYADDFLLGFAGPRAEAETIKDRIGVFLRDNLKLELSPEKTLITHAGTENARFLGYEIGVRDRRSQTGVLVLLLPIQKLEAKISKYQRDGKPVHRPELNSSADFTIVQKYGNEYRGFVQYYAYACNRHWLNHLRFVMESSMLRTLAGKHRSTVYKMARKYRTLVPDQGMMRRCYEVIVQRPGKNPLIARFGGLSLRMQPFLELVDGPTDLDRNPDKRTELIDRLLADTCEICGSHDRIQVHHIRGLKDLDRPGRKDRPIWQQIMSARQRKTLVVCKPCPTAIHAGRPTRQRVVNVNEI